MADVRQRIETHRRLPTIQIVNFRLERYDERGNRLQPIPVELRGLTVTGHVANGERVHVEGKFHNGTLYTDLVKNVTTGGGISSQATGRLGRRLGRRGVLLTTLIVLIVLVGCVRFIPVLWINTPFGLSEYDDEVHSTCTTLLQIGKAGPSLVFRSDGRASRASLLTSFDARAAQTKEQYRLLLSHTTPLIRKSRRDRVAALLPQLDAYFAASRRQARHLPRWFTPEDLVRLDADNQPAAAGISSRLSDAMSQLSGGECSAS